MKPVQKIIVRTLVAVSLMGGGYAAGVALQEPEIQTRTVTETEVVTETESVEVPGPVRWKTRYKTPQPCGEAIGAGMDMAEIIDEYDALLVDTYNTVDDAFNAGANFEGTGSTINTLNQLEDRTENLRDRWIEVPWYGPARRCR